MTIVDASIVIAIAFKEKHGEWAREYLRLHHGQLKMSHVNLFETLTVIRFRQPHIYQDMKKVIRNDLGIEFVATSEEIISLAEDIKHKYRSLNFGDCFVAAHAIQENCPLITIDSDFKKIDHHVISPF